MIVLGTRPEAVKMAPIVRELRERKDRAEIFVCATAQHRTMLDQMTGELGISPDLDLDLMRPDQGLAELTAESLRALDGSLASHPADAVLVQGDTTTAMAAALAAFYRKIPVGHVEAGLRTGNRYRPFPEEMNRRLITSLASWHFAPTPTAARALRDCGAPEESIHVTGNTVIDALLEVLARPERPGEETVLPSPGLRLVLVTAHRRESFGRPIEDLCRALAELTRRVRDIEVVYPVHLNPNIQEPVLRLLGSTPRVRLVAPLGYVPFARLMKRATLVLTDSGGIQEEAPALGVPVLVMREETERPEAVEAGVARLVGTDSGTIVTEAERLLTDESARAGMIGKGSPFGDGHAAERIVRVLLDGASYPAPPG